MGNSLRKNRSREIDLSVRDEKKGQRSEEGKDEEAHEPLAILGTTFNFDSMMNRSLSGPGIDFGESEEFIDAKFPNGPINLILEPVVNLDHGGKYSWNFSLRGNTNIVLGPIPKNKVDEKSYLMKTKIGIKSQFIEDITHPLKSFPCKTRFNLQTPLSIGINLDADAREITFLWSEGEDRISLKNWKNNFYIGICGHKGTKIRVQGRNFSNVKPARRVADQ